MYYTGLDPYTLKPVFVEKTPEGKAMQRALLTYYEPKNADKVAKALQLTHREDLIPLLAPTAARRMRRDVPIRTNAAQPVQPKGAHKGKTKINLPSGKEQKQWQQKGGAARAKGKRR